MRARQAGDELFLQGERISRLSCPYISMFFFGLMFVEAQNRVYFGRLNANPDRSVQQLLRLAARALF